MKKYDFAAVREIYDLPLPELIFRAQETHRRHHDPAGVQLCTLQSIKTGRCPEDCKYCPQSAHYNTGLDVEPLMDEEAVLTAARAALEGGASRFCMGAAWREVRDGAQFDSVLSTVRGVSSLGLEVCCTLGMVTGSQAGRLKEAGCAVYNHNLDTSREFYPEIITTRTYDERLATLAAVRGAGLQVCSGGILGMGETVDDRLKLLLELASLEPHPDSVPVNFLIPFEGTPLGGQWTLTPQRCLRILAMVRFVCPDAEVRLAGGREIHLRSLQPLALHIVNSIFLGDYLTSEGQPGGRDLEMIADAGFTVEGAEERTLPDHRDLVRVRRRGPGTELPANA